VEPLGFEMSDKQLRRAGLDYHEFVNVKLHKDFASLLRTERPPADRLFALSTRGARRVDDVVYAAGDWVVFGCETRGLDPALRQHFVPDRLLRLPMRQGNRSINLSNAVAVVVYEAWRQLGYCGGG
jgi:tRNA (cytidine/uridine-2'-O-)-methyltransferase